MKIVINVIIRKTDGTKTKPKNGDLENIKILDDRGEPKCPIIYQ